jgi:hypothetical protein
MVSCMLCPKRGGAMKPTNIFTSVDNYKKFNANSSSSKKHVKKHTPLTICKFESEPHISNDFIEK